jgi:hypothetical protein
MFLSEYIIEKYSILLPWLNKISKLAEGIMFFVLITRLGIKASKLLRDLSLSRTQSYLV